MQIKAFSEKVNVPSDTIRYYEKLGLIQPKREDNGYRIYDEECISQLKLVVVLKQLGFSLEEVGKLTMLKQQDISDECNAQAVVLFNQKIQQLTEKIQFFQQAIETLQLTQSLMEQNQYAVNQLQIKQSIDALFNAVKVVGSV